MRKLALGLAAAFVAGGLAFTAYGLMVPVKAWLSVHLLDRAWDRVLAGEGDVRPWPWMDSEPVARLTFPSPNRSVAAASKSFVVMRGVSGSVLAFAPGWHEQSVLPGQQGTAVIAAHRDTHFALLGGIGKHDRLVIEDSEGRQHPYEISHVSVTDEPSINLARADNRRRLLLVTCYPLTDWNPNSRQRLVMVADAV